MTETFAELEAFDAEFAPDGGRKPGIDALPDGDYDFEITAADLGRTSQSNEAILKLSLRVPGVGSYEHAYLFRNQTAVNILGTDLCTLGFDADQWKAPARPFSRELQAAVPRLAGVRFRGKKVTKPNKNDPSKPHANLYVNQRLDGTAPAPAAYAPPADLLDDAPF